jgi:polysaccharide deacetylase family protein (PEP-CTERM system associated)
MPALERLRRRLSRGRGREDGPAAVSEYPSADFFRRMSPRQVEDGLRALASLEADLRHRREMQRFYDYLLEQCDWPRPAAAPRGDAVLVAYPVRVADKALALEEASRRLLELGSGFEGPVHGAEGSLHLDNYPAGSCPEAERAAREVVTLPTHPRITEKVAAKCVELVCDVGPAEAPRGKGVRCPQRAEDVEVPHGMSVNLVDGAPPRAEMSTDLSATLERPTERLLEALAAASVHATFFVPGTVARKAPGLVRRIDAAGHEVQSHGFRQVEAHTLDRAALRDDVLRAKAVIEDIIGQEVYGYRAPWFSLDGRTPWAFDVLAETGHRYDSSVVPVKTARGGVAGYRPEPRIVRTARGHHLVEAPAACFHWLDRRWPLSGGDSLRQWPYWFLRTAMNQLERLGRPAVLHVCPCDYDPPEQRANGERLPLVRRLCAGLGRKGVPKKVDRLLAEFAFAPLRMMLAPLLAGVPRPAEPVAAAGPV